MKKIFLSKYSIALEKECRYLAKLINADFNIGIQLNRRSLSQCKSKCEVHIYNTSIATPWYLFWAKIYDLKTIFYCHEPNKKDIFKYYKGSAIAKHIVVKWINFVSIILSSETILLSAYGLKRAQQYPLMNRYSAKLKVQNIQLPKISMRKSNLQRNIILVFGQLNATKQPYWIRDYVKYSNFLRGKVKLVIVTASNEFDYLEKLQGDNPPKFSIIRSDKLTDEMISKYLDVSFATIHLHHCVTQSGAVVESLRHGVPVVCLNTSGFNQFYSKGIMELIDEYNYTDLDSSIKQLSHSQLMRREKCFEFFQRNFSGKQYLK